VRARAIFGRAKIGGEDAMHRRREVTCQPLPLPGRAQRPAAEQEERAVGKGGGGDAWLAALEPIGTGARRPHLTDPPRPRVSASSGEGFAQEPGRAARLRAVGQGPDDEAAMTDDPAYHYRVIARALAHLDAAGGTPLPLGELAARMGMSPAHFQRVFSAWVGVSPRRYQQYLALDHARRLLAERHSTLDAALGAGLSGTGRLHDLFIRWEAMSPGDYARAGEGLTIRWGAVPSPFGEALAFATGRGLCGLAFTEETGRAAALADMQARWPGARYAEDAAAVAPLAAAAFGGGGEARLHLIGAPFQIKVWEALLAIPSGMVTTYSDIARAVGRPAAVRAVGNAVGRNPVAWLVPCHRALRKSGALGGYRWGLPVKRAMLAWEAARDDAGRAA
jgi:AraC family transcriptional regulator of adaptative response/methylated-DNA-[protein]-cysteine methyltransferase